MGTIKSNCAALLIVLIAVIIVVAIVWCARYCGGNTSGWSNSSGGGECSDDEDCDSPRPRRKPKKSNCNWWVWVIVGVAVILLAVGVGFMLWRSFRKDPCNPKPETYLVREGAPCDRQSTKVTFVHDPPPPKIVGAVAGVCDDRGECTYVTTASNVKQSGPILTTTSKLPTGQSDLNRVLCGQRTF